MNKKLAVGIIVLFALVVSLFVITGGSVFAEDPPIGGLITLLEDPPIGG